MSLTFYYASGSPYAWRVWLTLEHKGIAHDFRLLSFDAGDLEAPAFKALNLRQRVPVIVDDGFVLYESPAILEYLEDSRPGMPALFAADARQRAVQRRMICEADSYVAPAGHAFFEALLEAPADATTDERTATAAKAWRHEIARWEAVVAGDYLTGKLSAADFTLYPMVALSLRLSGRRPALVGGAVVGPKLAAWAERMAALAVVRKTWPPHWR